MSDRVVMVRLRSNTAFGGGPVETEPVFFEKLTAKAAALVVAIRGSRHRHGGDVWTRHIDTGEMRQWSSWGKFPPESAMSAEEYLEIQARKFPWDWQIPAPSDGPRDTWQVVYADDWMDKAATGDLLKTRGLYPGPGEFPRQSAAGLLPRPVHYVPTRQPATPLTDRAQGGMPLWSHAEVLEWMRSKRLTASEAAQTLGVADGDAARRTLSRWAERYEWQDLAPVARAAGRGGESLYDTDAVIRAVAERPGQGARTDRKTP